jgi:hypothetical protein
MALAGVIGPWWAVLLQARVGLPVFANVNKCSEALQIMMMDRWRGRSRDGEAQVPTAQTRLQASSSHPRLYLVTQPIPILCFLRPKFLRFREAIETPVACYMAKQTTIMND